MGLVLVACGETEPVPSDGGAAGVGGAGGSPSTCPEPFAVCSEECVDVLHDARHCGGCDEACDPGMLCDAGSCSLTCPLSQTACDGLCVDTAADNAHCGGCDSPCDAGEICNGNGECALSCQQGLEECDGVCTDTGSSQSHCGGCNAPCDAGEICDGSGECALSCQAGLEECDGVCTDTDSSQSHCGGCDAPCDAGEICDGSGSCALSCQQGLIDCGGTCIDPLTDNSFCGAAGDCQADPGETCASGFKCDGLGVCALSCQPGLIECGGNCVDPATDNAFCGAQGDCQASPGEVCDPGFNCNGAGVCALSCQQGLIECGDTCVDPLSDNAYCGASGDCQADNGDTCAAGFKCNGAGVCALSCQAGLIECAGNCIDPSVSRPFCGATAGCVGFDSCSFTEACVSGSCQPLEVQATAGCATNQRLWATRPASSQTVSTSLKPWGVTGHLNGDITVVGQISGGTATFNGGTPQAFTLSGTTPGDVFALHLDGDGVPQWGARAASSGDNQLVDAFALPDGAVIVAGHLTGTTTFNPGTANEIIFTTGAGNDQAFVARLEPTGVFSWVKMADGNGDDFPERVRVRADGKIAMIGRFASTSLVFGAGEPAQTQISSGSGFGTFVAVYEANGEIDWAASISGPTNLETAGGLEWLADGSLAITGGFNQSLTLDGAGGSGTTLVGANERRLWLARYAEDGTLLWARQGSGQSLGFDLGQAADGSIAVYTLGYTGTVFGQGDPGQATAAADGEYVARYDSNGQIVSLQWVSFASEPQNMVVTPNGSVVHTGFYYVYANFPETGGGVTTFTNPGQNDAFFACADISGQSYWARQGTGDQHQRPQAATVMANGDVIITGWYQESMMLDPGTPEETTLGPSSSVGFDGFVVRFRP